MKRNFFKIGSVSVALTASLIISGCSSSEASHHWGYEGEYNPANWEKYHRFAKMGNCKLQLMLNMLMFQQCFQKIYHTIIILFIGSLITPPCSEGVKRS